MNEVFEDSIIATNCEIKNMIAETLADIKRVALTDDFIHTTKNKIYNKDPNVPEVFSLYDDVLLYNDWVVIPSSLQRNILRDFHMGHPEKKKTALKASCTVTSIGRTWIRT